MDFPMDGHTCPLLFGSCKIRPSVCFSSIRPSGVLQLLSLTPSDAYTNREIVYVWRKGLQASVDFPPESSSLLQYDLVGQTLFSETYKFSTGVLCFHLCLSFPLICQMSCTITRAIFIFCDNIVIVVSWYYGVIHFAKHKNTSWESKSMRMQLNWPDNSSYERKKWMG